MEVDLKAKVITITPTFDLAIFADGDHFGTLETLTDAVGSSGGTGKIVSMVVIDKEKQKPVFRVLLFSSAPTITSVDNAALDIADAEISAKFIGDIAIAAGDWIDLANSSIANVKNLNLKVQAALGSTNLYAIGISKGTPDFAAATPLTIKIGIEQD